ncbi:MAG TPA: hypothetical protein GYA10_10540 [Alphaproteobacteria bacterium]|nr:hypothetical protein [Alphaproteobacteria bacterium]
MSSLPPLPSGFVLEGEQDGIPQLPAGFVMEDKAGPRVDVRPNLMGVPLVGPMLSAVGFDGVPRPDVAPDAWEPPGVLMPMQRNTATGAVRPAVPQIVESLIDAVRAPGDALAGRMSDLEVDPATGAVAPFNSEMIERASNAAGWATGGAPGSTGATVLNAAGKRVPQPVVRAATADGLPLDQVAKRVDALGPEAVVADLGPNLRAHAAGATALPGADVDRFIDMMRLRKSGANDRIRSGLDETLGDAPIPSRLHAQIREAKRIVGPQYDRVLLDAPPVDVSGVANGLDGRISSLRGPAQSALRDVRGMLNGADGELETNAAVLFQVRQAIDGMIEAQADPNVRRVLQGARREVNDLLTEAAPGIRAVDAQYHELARQADAVDYGQRVLDSGRDAPRPAELADMARQGALPEGELVGPSGAVFRLSQGARAEIERVIGNNVNDRAALDRLMRGDGDWNRQRLLTLFGEERANRLFEILAKEARLADTEDAVLRAASRRADAVAQSDVAPVNGQPGAVQEVLNLRPGTAAVKILDDLVGGHGERRQMDANAAMLEELFGRGNWVAREQAPMSSMPVPIESWLAQVFGTSQAEEPPRQSRVDPVVLDLLLSL